MKGEGEVLNARNLDYLQLVLITRIMLEEDQLYLIILSLELTILIIPILMIIKKIKITTIVKEEVQ